MNLTRLMRFVLVVDHGLNVSSAARAINVAQGGISRQIIELERSLGFELLVRSGKHLTGLTDKGEFIYAEARKIAAIANDIDSYSRTGIPSFDTEIKEKKDQFLAMVGAEIMDTLRKFNEPANGQEKGE